MEKCEIISLIDIALLCLFWLFSFLVPIMVIVIFRKRKDYGAWAFVPFISILITLLILLGIIINNAMVSWMKDVILEDYLEKISITFLFISQISSFLILLGRKKIRQLEKKERFLLVATVIFVILLVGTLLGGGSAKIIPGRCGMI
jgi:hypothetical protein